MKPHRRFRYAKSTCHSVKLEATETESTDCRIVDTVAVKTSRLWGGGIPSNMTVLVAEDDC